MDENAAVMLEAGKALARAELSQLPMSGAPFIVLPNGDAKSMERFLPAPTRVRATVRARTTTGLIDYVTQFHCPGTAVFAWFGSHSFTAVIDGHLATAPQWCGHRCALTLVQTPDWQRWIGANRRVMGQTDFAQMIEDCTHNIAAPPGAELFEMVKSLWASKSVSFGSSIRLDNGQHQISFEETITGSAGKKGKLDIPSGFTLGLAPFEGSLLYELKARFRYRIDNGQLKLWYDLLRVENVLSEAYDAERAKVVDALTKLAVPVFDAEMVEEPCLAG